MEPHSFPEAAVSAAKNSAQILIATDFWAFATGMRRSLQRQSTNLSTGFCGYRKIHYTLRAHHGLPTAS
jgi:hypothetical protein